MYASRLRFSCLFVIASLIAAGFLGLGCSPGESLETIRNQQRSGDYQGSLEALDVLLAESPKDPEANFLYGRALVATGKPSLATWSLRQAMDHPDWLLQAGIQLAQAGLITGDFNEVVSVTTRMLADHPKHATALLYRAQAHAYWKKDAEAALVDANRVIELEPDLLEAYEPKIIALLALDRHEDARAALAEAGARLAASDVPESRLAWHCSTTAIFAFEGGDPDGASELFAECLEKFPADPTVVASAVEYYDATQQVDLSIAALRRALEESPEVRTFRVSLAERLLLTGKAAEGEGLLREATSNPNPRAAIVAWQDLASFRHSMKEHGAAVDALRRALEVAQELGEPHNQLRFQYADALVASDQLERALGVADELEVPAQRSLILGRVAQERGDATTALSHFDEALRLWPDNPSARYYTALAAEQLGDFERALEEYRYSIRISVGATDARTKAAQLLVAGGQPLLAYQLLFLEVSKAPLDVEGELLSMYLMALLANPKQLQDGLLGLARRRAPHLPRALARGAEGAEDRAGPRSALSLLRNAPGVDYREPSAAPALRVLVRLAHAAGEPEIAESAVAAALSAHPEAAVSHEINGQHLLLAGAPLGEVSAAYARALELDPNNPGALEGLGHLTEEGDPAAAVTLFDRAARADGANPSPKLAAALFLRATGQPDDALHRLNELLKDHPLEGAAAAEVVSLDLERNAVSLQTLDRARRAARFGGEAQDYEQLSKICDLLGRTAEAALATKHAEILSQRASEAAEASPASES